MPDTHEPRWPILVFGGGLELGLALAAAGLGWWLDVPPWRAMAWNGRDLLFGIAAALPLVVLLAAAMGWKGPPRSPVARALWQPLHRIQRINDDLVRPLFVPCSILELAGLSTLAGIGEEWFFRGFLQAALSQWLGPWFGWLGANSLFGVLHALTPTYALFATLAGVYFGWLWHATDNLLTPIVTHALYDWLALIYLTRRARPGKDGPTANG